MSDDKQTYSRKGMLCPACENGHLVEGSIYDDWESMLTCDNGECRLRVDSRGEKEE